MAVKRNSMSGSFLDVVWVLVVNITSVLTNMLTFVLLANYLGPVNFGLFSFSMAFGMLPAQAAGLGYEGMVVMNCSRDESTLPPEVGNAMLVRTVFSVVCVLGVYFAFLLMHSNPQKIFVVTIMTLSLCITTMADPLLTVVFRVLRQVRLPWFLLLVNKLLFLGCVVLVSHLKMDVNAVVMLHLLGSVTLFLLMFALVYRRIKPCIDIALLRNNFVNALTFCANQLVSLGRAGTGQIVLQILSTMRNVGLYGAAYRIVNATITVPSAIQTVFLPRFHAARTDEELTYWFLKIHRVIFVSTLLIAGAIFMGASDIIGILLTGGKYVQSVFIIRILVLSIILNFAAYPYSMLAESMRKLKERLIIQAISAGSAVVLCFILVPIIGLNGAAISDAFSWGVLLVLYQIITKRLRGKASDMIYMLKALVSALIASAFAAGIIYVMNPGVMRLLSIALVYGSAYLVLCFISGCVSKSDITGLKNRPQSENSEF